ncbi:hypothetical protein LguiB_021493 [Lonicera macranthoides]
MTQFQEMPIWQRERHCAGTERAVYGANKGYGVRILSREDISERKIKDQEEVGNKSGGDDNFKLDTSKSEKRLVVTKTATKNKSLPKRSRGCSKLFE